MKIREPKFLCCTPYPVAILALLRNYVEDSSDEIEIKRGHHSYDIEYIGKLTKKRLNELKMYALGCYNALNSVSNKLGE